MRNVSSSHSVTQDDFKEIRKSEEASVAAMDFPVAHVDNHNDKDDCSKRFWALWPIDIDKDTIKFNNEIKNDNIKIKESYQRAIREVTKGEYMIFPAFLIGASTYSDKEEKTFYDEWIEG